MHLLSAELEAQDMASGVVVSRSADIIFVQAVRVYATAEEGSVPVKGALRYVYSVDK